MHLLSEHRLLRVQINDINAQRKKAKASQLTQTGSDARTLDQRVLPGQAPAAVNQWSNTPSTAPGARFIAPGVNAPVATGGMVSSGMSNPVYFGATPDNPMGTGEVAYYDSPMTPGPTTPFIPTPAVQAPVQNQGTALAASNGGKGVIPGAQPQQTTAGSSSLNNFPNGAENMSQGVQQRLNTRLDKQAFIEQQRAAGKSDAEIRQMLKTMPPDAPAETPGATETPTPSATAPTGGQKTDPKTGKPKAGGKTAGTPGATGDAPAPVNPKSNFLRALAATVEDPIMQAILLAEADQADAALPTNPDLSQSEFQGGEDGKAIAKPFDAIDTILQRAESRARQTYAAQEAFLKGQYERNEKLNAQREESIKSQLQFQNDKAVREQKDANRKLLDQQTIMLALEGGFGSHDGNNELIQSRLKGEQAIIDLNKEFGFKAVDVSLAFTEAHNQAFDTYQQAWLAATDNFEAKVSNLDLQGISNQQAKSNALGNAYKEYVADIKAARQESAKIITDATKAVYEHIQKEKELKAEQDALENDREWRRMVFEDEKNFRERKFTEDNSQFDEQMEYNNDQKQLARDAKLMADRNNNIGKLSDDVEKRPEVKEYRMVETHYENLTRAWSEAQTSGNLVAADQAIIMAWNKILDSQSVVREAEYDRTGKDTPLANRIGGMLSRIGRGGVRMTDADRTAIKEMGDLLWDGYQKRMGEVAEDFILRLQKYNQGLSPEYHIELDDIGLPSVFGSSDAEILERANEEDGANVEEGTSPFVGGGASVEEYTSATQTRVSQGFSKPVSYIPGRTIHGGYDIAPISKKEGGAVKSFTGGEIVEVIHDPYPGQKKGWGNEVWVKDENGDYWRYTHVQNGSLPKPGTKVSPGHSIARIGNTGNSTGPHIHVEKHKGSKNGPLVDFDRKQLASHTD